MKINEIITETWSEKYKRSINCNNPKGFSQKAHCAGRNKNESTSSVTGKEMLKIFRGMHHDVGMNKDMDRYILSRNWQLRNFTPDMFPSEEEFFDYDDPFDRIIDIDYGRRVDLSQPIIVGPQFNDGKYSVVDGNHRAAAAQRMDKTIKGYFPVAKTNENFENRKNESTTSSNNYLLQLERDKRANMLVLHILNKQTGKRAEVRGKLGYETDGYDPNDKLHQLLDKIGKSASVSDLINGDVVSINPRHPDGANAKAATDKAYDEDRHPNEKPIGPETKPTMPAGTIRVKVSDVYDWYKLGQHISDLEGLGKHDFGKGPPEAVISFGSEEEEHKYVELLKQLGLDIIDIDPNKTKGVESDPTYNTENFADGKNPGRKGLSKRVGIPKGASVTQLRKIAKNSTGERRRMAHWQANMKSGRKKS